MFYWSSQKLKGSSCKNFLGVFGVRDATLPRSNKGKHRGEMTTNLLSSTRPGINDEADFSGPASPGL
jgi:hypothetical protein